MNYMPKVLEMLGVSIEERFNLIDAPNNPHYFNKMNALINKKDYMVDDKIIIDILIGEYEIEKLPWKPKEGELFYYVSIDYDIDCAHFYYTSIFCHYCFNAGNCFKTKEEITDEIKQRILQEMKGKYDGE